MMPLKRLACVAFFLTVPLWPVAFLLAAILALRRGLAPRVIAWANTKPPTKADRIAELERELGMVTS